jgi:DNA-binding response OmpR family regulator
MDDYLAKPYRPQDLLDRVRHWLPGRLAREEQA